MVVEKELLRLRKQKASLERAIRALEELQELTFDAPRESQDAAVAGVRAKVLPISMPSDSRLKRGSVVYMRKRAKA
jgi:hypothetical protein